MYKKESTKKYFAEWIIISDRDDEKEELNPIDRFLLDNEPAGKENFEKFRNQLLEAINFEDEEYRTDRNATIIGEFIEHCKENNFGIPDYLFESFFDA